MISAREALQRLRDGNQRFVSGVRSVDAMLSHTRRDEFADRQMPFAIILGCSDSRVPAEIVFDQGLGDLFVIRIAGNIVAPSQIGSVEFCAEQYGSRLVVVLGHSNCGAIRATIDEMQNRSMRQSHHISSIVDRIRPVIEPLRSTELWDRTDDLIHESVRANVRASANQLRHGSAILEDLIANQGLLVVGAEYSLETGAVEFFDGLPVSE